MKPKYIFISCIFFTFIGLTYAQSNTDISFDKIDSLFSRLDNQDSPGAAIAVIYNNDVVYKKCFGMANLEFDIPFTSSTVFDIASLSKQFTGMAVAKLILQGKLSMEDDIHKYAPEVPDYGNKMTISHLVYHTSGIRNWWGPLVLAGYNENDAISFKQIMKFIQNQKSLNIEPGEEFLYSNTGYNLLAETIARITGQSFSDWMTKNIFDPLDMKNSFICDDPQMIIKNRAFAYTKDKNKYKSLKNGLSAPGSSSLYTTLDDLVKWVLHFESAEKGDSEIFSLMNQQGTLNNGECISYAFGNFIRSYKGLKTVSHTGSWNGYCSMLIRFPEQHFAVIILSNLKDFALPGRVYRVADLFLSDFFMADDRGKKSKPKETSKKGLTIKPEKLKDYIGLYRLRKNALFEISLDGTNLMSQYSNELEYPMIPEAEDRFWVEAYKAYLIFHRNEKGEVTHLVCEGDEYIKGEYVTPTQESLNEYLGDYKSRELGTFYTIAIDKNTLITKHFKNVDVILKPSFPDIFEGDQWWMSEVKFTRNEKNEISGFLLTSNYNRNIRFIKK
jgi:CubicO group peptidase (beta-lactamase class C family)